MRCRSKTLGESLMDRKVIDWETAIDRLGGDKEFLIELLHELVGQIEQALPDLQKAIEQQDYSEVRSIAHGLKGAAANLGADQISANFYELEMMGKQENLTGALEKLNEVFSLNEDLKEELSK